MRSLVSLPFLHRAVFATVMLTSLLAATIPDPAAAAADAKTVAKCQAGLVKAEAKFVAKKLGLLGKCTEGVFKCIQTVDETGDAGAKRGVCVEKARGKCGSALASITAARQALIAGAGKACGGLDAVQLTGADGLGFAGIDCASFGGAATDLASATSCVVRQHDCVASRLFQLAIPRGLELLQFTPPDAVTVPAADADALACFEQLGGSGADVDDLALGKSVTKCQATVAKLAAKLAAQRLGSLAKCVDSLFVCAETKTGDDLVSCNTKARAGCLKGFGKNDDQAAALKAGIGKACGDAGVFAAMLSPEGGNFAALLPGMITIAPRTIAGCSPLATLADYETCIAAQVLDFADDLAAFAVPRGDDLLAGVGCTVDACQAATPTPTPTKTPTPTPTSSGSANAPIVTQILDATGDGTHPAQQPRAVAADADGNVYVAATASNNAFKISTGGLITQLIDATGDGQGHALTSPVGIAVASNGTVYVSGISSDNVFKITTNGAITQIIGATGDGTHGLDSPGQIAVDSDDTVYVSGEDSNNVFKITSGGTITQIVSSADADFPKGIAVDAQHNVFVASEGSNEVLKVTAGGTVSTIATSVGDGTHTMHLPISVAVSGTDVFVASGDDDTSAIFKITSSGTGAISHILDESVALISSIAADAAGNVYATSDVSYQAFKITPGGDVKLILDQNGDGQGHQAHLGYDPHNVAVDGQGRVYVAALRTVNVFKIVLP